MPRTPEQAAAIELVRREALARKLDPDYMARLAYLESGGNQAAVSPAGAIGLMQLMPDTAKGLGVNPRILEQNVAGGLNYFQSLLQKYGNYTDASRAYNWGPGNYDKYLAQQKALREGQQIAPKKRLQIPEETRKYLERLMGNQ
jgi:soluble lytic murein transglycosylase-like protein